MQVRAGWYGSRYTNLNAHLASAAVSARLTANATSAGIQIVNGYKLHMNIYRCSDQS